MPKSSAGTPGRRPTALLNPNSESKPTTRPCSPSPSLLCSSRLEGLADQLAAAGIAAEGIRFAPLAHGTYQCIDPFLGERFGGVLCGAEFGAPAGSVAGAVGRQHGRR